MTSTMNDTTQRQDVQCTECGTWMGWGTEYYDDEGNPYCPDHRP